MKRIFLFIALMLMPLAVVNAQDARGRATSTIVADALAQLPAELPATYNQVMAELASTGAEGIEQLLRGQGNWKWEGPLGTPLGLVHWKRASSPVEAGTAGYL